MTLMYATLFRMQLIAEGDPGTMNTPAKAFESFECVVSAF